MMRSAIALGLCVLSACSFKDPGLSGADASGGSGSAAADASAVACEAGCELVALDRGIADTGDTLFLEGAFGSPTIVHFPGDVDVPATVLGPHRATVLVPAAATTGMLSITTAGTSVGGLPFRHAPFALGLQAFQLFDDQTYGARQESRLVVPREFAATVTVGGFVYVIGGTDGSSDFASVERAAIRPDGSLDRFHVVSGLALTEPRAFTSAVVVGTSIYVVGGVGGTSQLGTIERSTIAPDGSLGAFSTVAGVALTRPRSAHTLTVIGSSLYVIGGFTGHSGAEFEASIERADISPDGELGAFTIDSHALTSARGEHAAVVTGAYLYVVGGQNVSGQTAALASVERAAIAADGTLGAFTAEGPLTTARVGFGTVMLGNNLYVIGGGTPSGETATIEHATIGADGSLSAFGTSDASLPVAGSGGATVITGNGVSVVGGQVAPGGATTSVARASLDASGLIGVSTLPTEPLIGGLTGGSSGVVVGPDYYMLGGFISTGASMALIQHARVGADGVLTAFETAPAVLAEPLGRFSTASIGDAVYVFGGGTHVTGDSFTTVEKAVIQGGVLGTFTKLTSSNLVTGRLSGGVVVAGNFAYMIGGFYSGETSIERAPIAADGTLGTFTLVSGVNLTTAHEDFTVAVLGHFLYVFGGSDASESAPLTTIERIALGPDGAFVGTFTASNSFVHARSGAVMVVAGSSLYALGGDVDGSAERATIAPDGSLGTFSLVPDLTLTGINSTDGLVMPTGDGVYICPGTTCGAWSFR